MDLRPLVRYAAERSWPLRKQAVRARVIAHLIAGNPHQLIIACYGLAIWDVYDSLAAGLAAWLSMVVAAELVLQYMRVRGSSPALLALVGWREAWRVRRRWPSDWAVVAAKTITVQAEVGTSEEPKAPAFRPICDHPKLSWIPSVRWPVITWWVGPPPGRSFQALEATTSILAANISHCQQIRVEFARASDSYGRLTMIFDDLDGRPQWRPPFWNDPGPDLEPGGPETVGRRTGLDRSDTDRSDAEPAAEVARLRLVRPDETSLASTTPRDPRQGRRHVHEEPAKRRLS